MRAVKERGFARNNRINGLIICAMLVLLVLIVPEKDISQETQEDTKSVSSYGITSSHYGVEIEKRADWGSYGGAYTDASGNPYVKYDIEISTTSSGLDMSQSTRSTDIVLLLDTSGSMSSTRIANVKSAAVNLVNSTMGLGSNVKFAVRTFDEEVTKLCDFTTNKTTVVNAINRITIDDEYNKADLHGAILAAQKDIINDSNADNCVFLVITDSVPNVAHTKGDNYTVRHSDPIEGTKKQTDYAKELLDNISVYTVGYEANGTGKNMLKYMASKNIENTLLNYNATESNISSILTTVANDLKLQIKSNKFVDFIPKELDLIENSISISSSKVSYSLSENNSKITFDWGRNSMGNEVYNFSFVARVNKGELPATILNNTYRLNTNGRTVYDGTDNVGSAYLYFSDKGKISLTSPKLDYFIRSEYNTGSSTEYKFSNKTRVTSVNGSKWDSNGNPYFKVTLEIDLLNADLAGKTMSLVNYVPPEYTVLTNSMESDGGAVSYSNNNRTIKWNWNNSQLTNKVYYVSFNIRLNLESISDDYINSFEDAKLQVFTGGHTIDVTKTSDRASVLTLGSDSSKLQSPLVTLNMGVVYSVNLHPNGGAILVNKGISRYYPGLGAILPDEYEIFRDGYAFEGWYESDDFSGDRVYSIGRRDRGNKNYYAKWRPIPTGEITANKIAEWTKVNGSAKDGSGNPYVKITLEADISFAYLDDIGNNAVIVDTIPSEYDLDTSSIKFSDSRMTYTYSNRKLTVKLPTSALENKKYTVTFNTKLVMSRVTEQVRINNDYIYTNGTTIDVKNNSNTKGSAYFAYGDTGKVELDSPTLYLNEPFKVTLHPNGGTFTAGSNITQYYPGKTVMLPITGQIFRRSYIFQGWYTNSGLNGTPVANIKSTDRGNKEFWAKWIPEGEGAKVTKRASWTTLSGRSTDASGNPYAKIEFDVDLTSAQLVDFGTGGGTDVILLIDTGGVGSETIQEELNAAKTFVNELFAANSGDLRIGMMAYATRCYEILTLNDSDASTKNGVINAIENGIHPDYIGGANNGQQAIVWAQRQLMNYSSADRGKVIIKLCIGVSSLEGVEYLSGASINDSDVVNPSTVAHSGVFTSWTEQSDVAIAQMNKAKSLIPGLQVIAVGISYGNSYLTSSELYYYNALASTNENGDKMVYTAKTSTSGTSYEGLSSILQGLTANIITKTIDIKLTDIIPPEFSVVRGFITVSDPDMIIVNDEANRKVSFDFKNVKLQNKIYTFSLITKLNVNKVGALTSNYIYSNGNKLDVSNDSTGSSYLEVGDKTIELTSPKLKYGDMYDVTLHTNGGIIAAGRDVKQYMYGQAVTLPTAAYISKLGHTFAGWFSNSTLSGNPVLTIPTGSRGNKEYWAKWTPNVYNVTLHENGGVWTPEGTGEITKYTYGEGVILPGDNDIVRDEYEFTGWYDNSSCTGTPVSSIAPTEMGDKVYWAGWKTIDIPIEDKLVYVYVVKGYKDIYRTEKVSTFDEDATGDKVIAYFTEKKSKNSTLITSKEEMGLTSEAEIEVPYSVQELAVKNNEDQEVYLQLEYENKRRIIKVVVRPRMSFDMF